MQPVQTFNVSPRLPENLEPLRELAHNLWWTWEPDARRLFRHLDTQLWDRTNHNPIRMLQLSRQARLIELAADDDYIREMQAVYQKFKAYMARTDTYGKLRADRAPYRLFFGGIRVSRIRAKLFRRSRYSFRRSLQIGK